MALVKKICLVILDGWGIGKEDFSNAIYQADTPNIEKIKKYYPMTTLQASGISVGLPYNEAGNSEVGHLTLGTGQILYQYVVRISQSIKNKTFFQNPSLLEAYHHAKKNKSTLHLIGLLSSNIVHSSYDHLIALLDMADQLKIDKVSLHLFTDGRDSSPTAGKEMIKKLEEDLKIRGQGEIATISGRFYAMDRDKNYNRIQKCYDALVFGKGKTFNNSIQYLEESYKERITDEFIIPAINQNSLFSTTINPSTMLRIDGEQSRTINDNDSIIFFNFREERMRELAETFANPQFNVFPIKSFQNLKIVTFTRYRDDFPFPIAFPPQQISINLAQILSSNKKRQLHLSETEKYAHVTYFFDGLQEKPNPGEYWVIIPSIKTLHLEDYPQLRAPEITTRLLQAFEENIYDFILVNYANPDLIGHTGNLEAGIECAKIIDTEIQKVINEALKFNYTLLITADHGNLEIILNPLTGEVKTEHDANLVPFYLIDNRWKLSSPRSLSEIKEIEHSCGGMLADISPTILELFGLSIPQEMTGQSLLPLLGIR